MRVERFALFFPPLLARKQRGETEYAIGAIPLGGYVKITGMNPEEEIPPEVAHRAYFRQPVWKRIVVIAAGPAVNIVLAFLMLAGIYWANGTTEPPLARRRHQGRLARRRRSCEPGDVLVSVDGKRPPAATTLRDQNQLDRGADRHAQVRGQRPGLQGDRAGHAGGPPRRAAEQTLTATPVYDAARRSARCWASRSAARSTRPGRCGPPG